MGASSWSTFGRTRASTGCGPCPTSARGPERYRDRGLVVVGVHAPEFGFEHDLDNVRQWDPPSWASTTRSSSTTTSRIWQSFGEPSGPPFTSPIASSKDPLPPLRRGQLRGDRASDPAAPGHRRGNRPRRSRRARRGRRLGHPEKPGDLHRLRPGASGRVDSPAQLALNHWALSGNWAVEEESAALERPAARSRSASTRATSTSSSRRRPRAPRPASRCSSTASRPATTRPRHQRARRRHRRRAADVSARPPATRAERTFEITFLDPGVRAYVFTFG